MALKKFNIHSFFVILYFCIEDKHLILQCQIYYLENELLSTNKT
jgi:hypothetical protein